MDRDYVSKYSAEVEGYAQAVMNRVDRFFVTRHGFIGLTRHPVGTGDVVGVFYGCGMPAILSKKSNYPYTDKLVGGSYVSGLMRGELIDDNVPGMGG